MTIVGRSSPPSPVSRPCGKTDCEAPATWGRDHQNSPGGPLSGTRRKGVFLTLLALWSLSLLVIRERMGQYVNEWVWPCANETLFQVQAEGRPWPRAGLATRICSLFFQSASPPGKQARPPKAELQATISDGRTLLMGKNSAVGNGAPRAPWGADPSAGSGEWEGGRAPCFIPGPCFPCELQGWQRAHSSTDISRTKDHGIRDDRL